MGWLAWSFVAMVGFAMFCLLVYGLGRLVEYVWARFFVDD